MELGPNILVVSVKCVMYGMHLGKGKGTSNLYLKNTFEIKFKWLKCSKSRNMQIYLCWLFYNKAWTAPPAARDSFFLHTPRSPLPLAAHSISFIRALAFACGMPNVLCGCILIEIFLYLHTLTVLYRNCYSTLIYILFYTYVCVVACVYHVADISAAIVLFAVDELRFAHVHPLPFAFHAAAPRCAACWLSWFKVQQKH